MSGLREVFDEIVADVPVYGDLDRAIEQVEREQRRRYGAVAGLVAAAAVVAVIVGIVAITRDDDSTEPVGPSTETRVDRSPDTTAPVDLPANGRLAGAEDLFARVLEPCSVITADFELATPGADCTITAHDVDAEGRIGLFEELATDAGNGPNSPPPVATLRVATRDEVVGRFPSPYEDADVKLGPGRNEISLSHGQEITVVGFDGEERRSIDLSSVLSPAEAGTIGEEVLSLEWAPDGTRVAFVSRLHTDEGMSARLWVASADGTEPQLLHAAVNEEVPANKTPLAYLWSVVWSPDGSSLGFIEELAYLGGTEESESLRAATLTLSGSGASVPRTLYDYPSSTAYDEAEIVWSPDAARVALRVPDQVLELSAEDGRVLDRHPLIAGKLTWLAR